MCFLLTKTYMEIGNAEVAQKQASRRSPGLDALVNRLKHHVLEADFWPGILFGRPVIPAQFKKLSAVDYEQRVFKLGPTGPVSPFESPRESQKAAM